MREKRPRSCLLSFLRFYLDCQCIKIGGEIGETGFPPFSALSRAGGSKGSCSGRKLLRSFPFSLESLVQFSGEPFITEDT